MGYWADRMVDRFDTQAAWPDADDQRVWDQVRTWIAFRESDRNVLREQARWRNQVRQYLIDPLAPKISEAFASVIFGQRIRGTAAKPDDQARLEFLIKGNNFARRLQREEKRTSSEGEVWYRTTSDPEADECPMVVFHSRLDVIPTISKDKLRSVAFIDLLDNQAGDGEQMVWRHFEIYDDQSIRNVLYEGTHDTIGARVALADHPETADLAEEVEHELPYMPAGRIFNQEGIDPFYGISDYAGIEDFLYGLNEILTIFHENVRLTLKKRVVVPPGAVDEAGTIDASQEVLVDQALHEEVGGAGQGASSRFNVLEYKSDIDDVITAQNAEAEAALTRVGITPAFVGMSTDQSQGRAVTGTALRIRLIPTVNAGEDRAQHWDDELPKIVTNLQILDARSSGDAAGGVLPGFGRSWVNPAGAPAIERGPSLPEDPVEESEVQATRIGAGITSRKTAIKALHPDWSDDQVNEEIALIKQDAEDTPGAQALGSLLESGRRPPTIRGVQ